MSHCSSRSSPQGWLWTSHRRSGSRETSNSRLGGNIPQHIGDIMRQVGDTAGPEDILQQDGGIPQQLRAHPTATGASMDQCPCSFCSLASTKPRPSAAPAPSVNRKQLCSSASMAPTKDPWEDTEKKKHWKQRAPFQKQFLTGSFQQMPGYGLMVSVSTSFYMHTTEIQSNRGLTTNGGTFGHLCPLWEKDITKTHPVFLSLLLSFFLLYFPYFSNTLCLFLPFFSLLTPFLSLFLPLRPYSISLGPLFYSHPPACPVLTSRSLFPSFSNLYFYSNWKS